jgi:glycerophosphoryl diester phosphodiesterase
MLLIAHRGSSGVAPENTLTAFHRAVHDGADMIELDVRLSADGVPVVIHDRRLFRTTGIRGKVREWAASDLEELDAGSWFDRSYAGEGIPRLATVLRLLPAKVGLNVEVKTDGDRRRRAMMMEKLGNVLSSAAGKRALLVSSFDHAFLQRLHRRVPALPLGVLYLGVRDLGRSPVRLARRAGATVFVCSRSQLQARWVRMAHAENIRVLVYGVNIVRHLLLLRDRGVDGVITDEPAQLRRALSTHA